MDCKPKLRFPEFTEEWGEFKFGEYLDVKSGYGFKASEYVEEGVPLVKIDNVTYGKIKWDSITYLPNNYLEKYPDLVLEEGDVLLALNRPITQNKLKIGIIKKKNSPAILYQRVGKIVFKTKSIDKKFSYYNLTNQIYTFVKKSSVGSDQPFISTVELKKLKITSPSLSEQQKIASFLSKVDSKIDLLEKKQELWENYKKGIMQQIFSQKLRFNDENGEDYPDWEKKKFNQIFKFIPTNSFSRANLNYETGNVHNIHYGDIHTKYLILLDFENTEVPFINDDVNLERIKPESYCKDGDLVIADASEDYGDIGKAIELINLGDKKVLAGLHTFLARDKAGYTISRYRSFMLLDASVKLQIQKLATGVSVLGISKSNLGSIRLPVPSLQEQSKIAGFLSAIGSKIEQLNKELEMNKEFKRGLLQQMFC